ncbi:MAG: flippase [bacterium]
MSLYHKIAKNTIIQIIGRALQTLIAFLTLALIMHYLGPSNFGQYTIVVAYVAFSGILIDLGIYMTTLQMISEPLADAEKIFSNAFTLRVIATVLFLLLAASASLFFPYDPIAKKGILILLASCFFISLAQLLHGIFQKELKMAEAEIAAIIGKIVLIILVAAAIHLKLNLLYILTCLLLGDVTYFLLKYFFSRKYIKIKFSFDKDIWIKIIIKSWPIALSIIFNLIYLRGDTIILSLFAPPAEVGFYGASYKVLDVLTTLPIIIAGLMMPLFTNAWAEKNYATLKFYLQNSFDACAMIAIPIIFGTQFIAYKVMVLAGGNKFYPAGRILKILIIAVTMIFFGTLFGHFIVAINKQKTMLFGYLATAILSLIGYFVLIPKFTTIGAAYVTLFSETLITVLSFIIIRRTTGIAISLKKFLKALLAGLAMCVILYPIRFANMLILILTGAAIYGFTLYAIGVVDKKMLQQIFKPAEKKS